MLPVDRAVLRDDRRGNVRAAEIDADSRLHGRLSFALGTGGTRKTRNRRAVMETIDLTKPAKTTRAGPASRRTPSCSTHARSNTSIRSRSTKSTSRSRSTKRRRGITTSTRSTIASGSTSITTTRRSSARSGASSTGAQASQRPARQRRLPARLRRMLQRLRAVRQQSRRAAHRRASRHELRRDDAPLRGRTPVGRRLSTSAGCAKSETSSPTSASSSWAAAAAATTAESTKGARTTAATSRRSAASTWTSRAAAQVVVEESDRRFRPSAAGTAVATASGFEGRRRAGGRARARRVRRRDGARGGRLAVTVPRAALAFRRTDARRTHRRGRRRRRATQRVLHRSRQWRHLEDAGCRAARGCRSSTGEPHGFDRRARRRRRAIRRSSTPAAARACSAPISPSATASISRPTAGTRGRISVCATGSRSPRWRSIRTIRSGSSSPCSVTRTDRTPSAASIARLDGGATFQRVLFENDDVGAFDVAIDPHESADRLRDALGCASSAVGNRRLVRDRRAAASSNRPTAERRGRR